MKRSVFISFWISLRTIVESRGGVAGFEEGKRVKSADVWERIPWVVKSRDAPNDGFVMVDYLNRRAPNNIFRFQRAICLTVRNALRTILERYLIKANLPLLRVMG